MNWDIETWHEHDRRAWGITVYVLVVAFAVGFILVQLANMPTSGV